MEMIAVGLHRFDRDIERPGRGRYRAAQQVEDAPRNHSPPVFHHEYKVGVQHRDRVATTDEIRRWCFFMKSPRETLRLSAK